MTVAKAVMRAMAAKGQNRNTEPNSKGINRSSSILAYHSELHQWLSTIQPKRSRLDRPLKD